MNIFKRTPAGVPAPEDCLPGRSTPIPTASEHYVTGRPIKPPFPANMRSIVFGMGCFWGAERLFWEVPGVYTTAAGYSGGTTPNPTYEETCTSRTGHTEAVIVVFDPAEVDPEALFKVFWENHDPTQYMGQGNDIGSQYRSAIYAADDEQQAAAVASRDRYQSELQDSGFGKIQTEIAMAGEFYYAEEPHQQYLAKNPYGYCNHGFCQVAYSR
ncbi:MAG: peptide-methionine (S)-S-oxide reductase MsrA [Dehalococcoidia bacterium]|nr:peptide-methionine (S)-S-oxide reductase MsrA [Dehalococcoidia bacterium]